MPLLEVFVAAEVPEESDAVPCVASDGVFWAGVFCAQAPPEAVAASNAPIAIQCFTRVLGLQKEICSLDHCRCAELPKLCTGELHTMGVIGRQRR